MDPSASFQGHTDNGEAVRPFANYQPDIWSDVFSDYTPLDQVIIAVAATFIPVKCCFFSFSFFLQRLKQVYS